MTSLPKRLVLYFLVCLFFFSGLAIRTEASLFDSKPIILIYQATDAVTRRVTDIVYYLVMQKRYIFNHFYDPNTYVSWEVPANFEKIVDSLVATSVPIVSGRPIAVTTTTVPAVKPIETAPANDSQILKLTNEERQKMSLKSLSANSDLDEIASQRIDDLFANQYFKHNSPDGRSATDLAKKVGYDYLLIGENLALGNFAGDQGIVTAWMNSPGHRANILNDQYEELGVAVRDGLYEGRKTTIAVQIFGHPGSFCLKPNSGTKSLITTSSDSIKEMQAQAQTMYNDLALLKNNPETDRSYYNQKIQEYNYFAKKINDAVLALKNIIDTYNTEVSRYNSCINQ